MKDKLCVETVESPEKNVCWATEESSDTFSWQKPLTSWFRTQWTQGHLFASVCTESWRYESGLNVSKFSVQFQEILAFKKLFERPVPLLCRLCLCCVEVGSMFFCRLSRKPASRLLFLFDGNYVQDMENRLPPPNFIPGDLTHLLLTLLRRGTWWKRTIVVIRTVTVVINNENKGFISRNNFIQLVRYFPS